ncbi:MAG TPA: hypothetical protein VGB50_12255 [Flavobacterium sp.]
MKKNYTFLAIICCVLSSFTITAQLVANDDSATINGALGGSANTIANDTFNGSSLSSCSAYIFTQISSSYSGFNLTGVCGSATISPGTPVGTYTLVYKICQASNPSNCDTATVTVNVCAISPPGDFHDSDPAAKARTADASSDYLY